MAPPSVSRSYTGRAAHDLGQDSVTLKVIVPSLTPAMSGGFGPATAAVQSELRDPQQNLTVSNVTVSNHIEATWYGGSNRAYPPNVVAGEHVTVFQIGDTDQWYWDSIGRDHDQRKKEVYRVFTSDVDTPNTEKDDDNTYFFEIDTVKGAVTISTCKADGEAFRYTIRIDTEASTLQAADDVGNRFVIDSTQKSVSLINQEQCITQLIDKNVIVGAVEDLILRAGRQIVYASPAITGANGGGGAMVLDVQSLAIKAPGGLTMEAPTIGLDGNAKVTGALVSKTSRSGGYGVGDVGAAYGSSSIDVATGAASSPSNAADTEENTSSGARHATAHEDFMSFVQELVRQLQEVQSTIGVPGNPEALIPLAQRAIMSRMRGD